MSSSDSTSARGVSKKSSAKHLWNHFVRDGAWFTWDRICFVCAFSAFILIAVFLYLFLLPNAFTSSNGTFLMDYLSFWLAGHQALAGTPEVVYHLDRFSELQQHVSASDTVFAFFYPPTFQLLQVPYALLPVKLAHVTFVITTALLLWWVLRLIVGNGLWAACLLMVPASLNNAFHGQNAALTAALYALFLISLERKRPIIAGIAIGVLTIKPQLGLLAPIALIASYNWRCFISASVTAICLAGASFLVLGNAVWASFIKQVPVATTVMQNGFVEWEKMISLYSSLRQVGVDHSISFSLQLILAFVCLSCVFIVWRRTNEMSVRAPVLVAGTLLSTPFALSYDLTLLIVPTVFLIRVGLDRGFLPYEKSVLAVFILLSSLTSAIAMQTGVPIAPLLPLILLLLGLQRYCVIARDR